MRQFLAALLLCLGFSEPALAQQSAPPVCRGENLLEKARIADPAAYAAYEREAARFPNAEGLFWRVERDGVPASHLFGTMHLTDPRITDLPEDVTAALRQSRVLALELASLGDVVATAKEMSQVLHKVMTTDGRGLDDIPSADRPLVLKALEERGVPENAAGQFQPWFLALTMAVTPCELARQKAQIPVLDAYLASTARSKGIPVEGLETIAEQIDIIASIDPQVIRRVLIDTARAGEGAADAMETMIQLYLERRVGYMLAAYRQITSSEEEFAAGIAFLEALLGPRNTIMRDRSLPLLAEGNAFIAVGALHLSGPEGLVQLYRDAGYTVTRLW